MASTEQSLVYVHPKMRRPISCSSTPLESYDTRGFHGGPGGNRTRVQTTYFKTELQLLLYRNFTANDDIYAPIFKWRCILNLVSMSGMFINWVRNTSSIWRIPKKVFFSSRLSMRCALTFVVRGTAPLGRWPTYLLVNTQRMKRKLVEIQCRFTLRLGARATRCSVTTWPALR